MGVPLQAQLIALTVVVALAGVGVHALIVSGQSISDLEDSLATKRAGTAAVAARGLGDVLSVSLADLQRATAALTAEDLDDGSKQRLSDQLDPLLAGSFASVAVYSQSGAQVYARPAAPSSPPPFPMDGPRLDASPGGLAWVVPLAAGKEPHYVVAEAKPSRVHDALFGAAAGEGMDVLLVDGHGRVLLSTAGARLAPLDADSRSASSGTLAADAAVPGLAGLRVVALGSADELAALRVRLAVSTIGVAALVAGLAVVLGLALARRVATPIQHLSATAVRLRTGESDARAIPSGAREVQQLARDLNALVDQLDTERARMFDFQKDLERSVERRTRQLANERQALEEFAYVVSHDLRAPLRGISLQLELLLEEMGADVRPPVQKAIERAQERVSRLDSMIVGVLEYSRRGRVPTLVRDIDVAALLREVVDSLHPRGGLHVQWDEPMPVVKGDQVQVRQVFQNLIANALGHHDRHVGHVTITARDEGAHHEFVVEDDGPGVSPESAARLFHMFGAGSSDTSRTGVGLAVVRRIVESNGGTIRHEPAAGRGSRFVFTWPKVPLLAEPSRPTEPSADRPQGRVSVRRGRAGRVLRTE